MKPCFKYTNVLAFVVIPLLLFFPNKIRAQKQETYRQQETYRPPKGNVRRQVRRAGGTRGCNLMFNDTVTLLVPQNHTATTTSEHPIFFWYLSQKLSLPLRFTLLEPEKEPIFTKEFTPEPGIVALKLPDSMPSLEIGKTYRWTVTVVCNEKKPSRNLFAQAWIERVPSPRSNQFAYNLKNNRSFCLLEYGRAGIWYDALACNYPNLVQKHHNPYEDSQEFWSLLEQIDLEDVAQKKPTLSLY